jgi:hypothetical protein
MVPDTKRITILVDAVPLGGRKYDSSGGESIGFSVSREKSMGDALREAAKVCDLHDKGEYVDRPDVF